MNLAPPWRGRFRKQNTLHLAHMNSDATLNHYMDWDADDWTSATELLRERPYSRCCETLLPRHAHRLKQL
eukprot:6180303-Pleurochrysis_carterae.AAC.4